jgi:hypothetical protein
MRASAVTAGAILTWALVNQVATDTDVPTLVTPLDRPAGLAHGGSVGAACQDRDSERRAVNKGAHGDSVARPLRGIDTTFLGLFSGSIRSPKTKPTDDEIRRRFPSAETPASHGLYP